MSSPCVYGTCSSIAGNVKCTCVPGYTGTYCEIQINYCTSNPCQNNAGCTPLLNRYVCSCPLGYSGTNCELIINPCSTTTCLNGGFCNPVPGAFDFT